MKRKKGISSIIGGVVFLLILALSTILVVHVINTETNTMQKNVYTLEKNVKQKPLLYEYFDSGVTYLMSSYPTTITYIYYPNGSFVPVHILLNERVPVLQILNGQPWAVVITSDGAYYNVSLFRVPGVLLALANPSKFVGKPWDPSVLDVSQTPNWDALWGIAVLNKTMTPISCPTVSWLGYTEGQTDKMIEYYVNTTTPWLVITYYAPLHYTTAYNSYYDMYYNKSLPSSLTPTNNSNFYILLTSNPYIKNWTPLWDSAVYYQAQGKNITNPNGGIEFHYDYINATIGVYAPVTVNNVIQYSYIYFRDFEVTNVSALVPSAVTNNGTAVKVINATWRYSPFSWIDAPLLQSPSTGAITTAYSNNLPTFTLNLYPSGSYQYAPVYENFPTTDYGGFPAYFGEYTIPGHNFDLSNPNYMTSYEPISIFSPLPTQKQIYTYSYISSSSMINQYYDPITVYQTAINFQQGVILNYGYNPMTGTWLLLYEGHLQPTGGFFYKLPIYITIPQGVYLLSFNTSL